MYRVVEQVAYAQPVQPPQPVYYNPDVVPLPASSAGSGGGGQINQVNRSLIQGNETLAISKGHQDSNFGPVKGQQYSFFKGHSVRTKIVLVFF